MTFYFNFAIIILADFNKGELESIMQLGVRFLSIYIT